MGTEVRLTYISKNQKFPAEGGLFCEEGTLALWEKL